MPPATLLLDCKRFAGAIQAAGGTVPDALAHLLSAHDLLSRPAAADAPENSILDAALDGTLTAEKLNKLLPAAANAHTVNEYRAGLARQSEHVLIGQWHRVLAKDGCADAILDSLRPQFDRHAEAIAAARSLFTAESTPEHVLASGQPGTIEAWQTLDEHLRVVAKIGAIASQFGCRPAAQFPQVTEFANADTFRIVDAAVMCTAGNLVTDSALFGRPDQGHRTSPWARTTLRLHTISEARDRYNSWAADEFDRIHSGPPGGWIDEHGKMHENPRPTNPFREKASTR